MRFDMTACVAMLVGLYPPYGFRFVETEWALALWDIYIPLTTLLIDRQCIIPSSWPCDLHSAFFHACVECFGSLTPEKKKIQLLIIICWLSGL